MKSRPIFVDAWIDLGCPFCYVQLPVFDELRHIYGKSVELRWHAFEVTPAPEPLFDAKGPRLLKVFEEIIVPLARERGLRLNVPVVISRTKKGLEAIFTAREVGLVDAVYKGIAKAYFEKGVDISSVDTLVSIGAACGVDETALRSSLEAGRFSDAVVADREFAALFGITGLPFVLVSEGTPAVDDVSTVVIRGTAPVSHYQVAIDRLMVEALFKP